MRTLIAVCLVAVGCARDLSEVSDREPEPAYLGELSGLYELSLLVPDPHSGDPLAAMPMQLPYGSRLRILHLRDPEGEDHLIGVEEESYGQTSATVAVRAEAVRLFFEAAFDGASLVGGSNRGPLRGKRVAGGGMVAFDSLIPVCEGGPRYAVAAKLLCPVNPALSGVYGGVASDCGSGMNLGNRYLALGFVDESFLGLSLGGAATLVEGYYSHVAETGAGFSYGLLWEEDAQVEGTELFFNLAEFDNQLHLGGELYAFAACNSFPCPEPVCEDLSLARLSGGTAAECYGNEGAPAVGSASARRDFGDNGGRFLYVDTQVTELSSEKLGVVFARGILRPVNDVGILIEGEPPDPCTEGCACDLDCCDCNQTPDTCDAGCDCDWECSTCFCEVPDGSCDGTCRCDGDCWEVCSCNTDASCTANCFCDPDCFCECERPPEYALRFPLPPVPDGSTVDYELFVTVFDPLFFEEVPTAPRCIHDDGLIDAFGDPSAGGR